MAALCYRDGEAGPEVLLITSRGTGRWIIPKGWPMAGKSGSGAALEEAWEEAGVRRGRVNHDAIGSYTYDKRFNGGYAAQVETLVYAVEVEQMCKTFPEAHERTRRWVRPDEAANLVDEPDLKEILCDFEDEALVQSA
ncbi:NUDIX hydrolase [Vannielia sp.]|uniref:NUDIX hydrolase n=1 Tax=Vannielia sp. TaxID=2813045 RepID=UPI0034598873